MTCNSCDKELEKEHYCGTCDAGPFCEMCLEGHGSSYCEPDDYWYDEEDDCDDDD
jgi:hypothetical protein